MDFLYIKFGCKVYCFLHLFFAHHLFLFHIHKSGHLTESRLLIESEMLQHKQLACTHDVNNGQLLKRCS